MNQSRRQKRVASLIQEALSRILIQEVQDSSSGLITITRVDVTADLKVARIGLSSYGQVDKRGFLLSLEKRKGHLRKALASEIKLKYNPSLIFTLDETPEYEKRLDELLEKAKGNEG